MNVEVLVGFLLTLIEKNVLTPGNISAAEKLALGWAVAELKTLEGSTTNSTVQRVIGIVETILTSLTPTA